MIVTATRFYLDSWIHYFRFFLITVRVFRQAKKSRGIVLLKIDPIGLRTVTVWKTREDMTLFRNSGAHQHAMKASAQFGTIQSYTWEVKEVPSWKEAINTLKDYLDS